MSLRTKYFPVNWIDGMKISRQHFAAQDQAMQSMAQDAAVAALSPVRYGLLPGYDYQAAVSVDNQGTIRVSVQSCEAVTPAGARISVPGLSFSGQEGGFSTTLPLPAAQGDGGFYVFLVVNPFDTTAGGQPDVAENPPRLPWALPSLSVALVPESTVRQGGVAQAYGIPIGRLTGAGASLRAEEEYIPPCLTLSAHPDLAGLHGELDQFLSRLELNCAQIVQKIYRKSQQNAISELVQFLCDRTILFLAQAIADMRLRHPHDSPVAMFATMAGLSRVLKNAIDMRIGSGKEELINYLAEWSQLSQGELDRMFADMAALPYLHADVNRAIGPVVGFARTVGKLFESLAGLDFIGKKKESGIFVTEEAAPTQPQPQAEKPKRRFFG